MRLNLYKNLLPESNSQTTSELRYFIENGATLFDNVKKYPIWKEEHRQELEEKIIDHYYMSQIGFETFGRFKHELNTRMREIMPYYVELYKTTQYDYNPIENYSMQEGSEDLGTSEGSSKGLQKYSDTPQSKVENLNTHLTNVTQNDASSKGSNKTSHTAWRKGNIGVTTSQQMIEQERDIILNIDKLIIEELQDLFLGVY